MTPTPQCRAKSRRSGQRCKNRPMVGQSTCRMHGGSSPQAKASARERLAAMADPAANALGVVLARALQRNDLASAIRAAVAVLDRSGHGPGQTIAGLDLDALSEAQLREIAAGRPLLEVLTRRREPTVPPQEPERPTLRVLPAPPPADEDEEVAL